MAAGMLATLILVACSLIFGKQYGIQYHIGHGLCIMERTVNVAGFGGNHGKQYQ
ncbi:hypothetical protein [Youngiibacter fragilis]|uniref:hypothetical protein n=1 Tax=Youngiibacter fragilis TaxID=1408819 RepID=UPI001A9A3635|nr:hypothetical protein [Youngiibacter fragilis]